MRTRGTLADLPAIFAARSTRAGIRAPRA
jgi:hypothetical protein